MGESVHPCASNSSVVPTGVPDDSSLPGSDIPTSPDRQSFSYKGVVEQSETSGTMNIKSKLWVRVATRSWEAKLDSDLRLMLAVEEEALAAWVIGSIVLQRPPGFFRVHTLV